MGLGTVDYPNDAIDLSGVVAVAVTLGKQCYATLATRFGGVSFGTAEL
jgi:hypothetical protein